MQIDSKKIIKKKVLLSAFACKPASGSEFGVGWNFFVNLSKTYDVHLLTEIEHKKQLEDECAKLGISLTKLHFVEISGLGRKKLYNQGDWSFYLFYHMWQRRALIKAKEIHAIVKFDLVHHLNMIGFREPGLLYKLGIPFVLGPLGGFGGVPNQYFNNKFSAFYAKNVLKNLLNYASLHLPNVRYAIKNASQVVAAYPEAADAIHKHLKMRPPIIPETGTLEHNLGSRERKNYLWIGKDQFRKQFRLAAEAFLDAKISREEKMIVIGNLSSKEVANWSGYSNIIFLNNISHAEVLKELSSVRALIFTSLHEGNPHVVYEAIANTTPVICHDSYGMGLVTNNNIGIKIPVIDYESSRKLFTQAIDEIVRKKYSYRDFKSAQIDNTWSARAKSFQKIYERVLAEKG